MADEKTAVTNPEIINKIISILQSSGVILDYNGVVTENPDSVRGYVAQDEQGEAIQISVRTRPGVVSFITCLLQHNIPVAITSSTYATHTRASNQLFFTSFLDPQELMQRQQDLTKRLIEKHLVKNNWHRIKTAKELGISRNRLYKKMQLLGIDT